MCEHVYFGSTVLTMVNVYLCVSMCVLSSEHSAKVSDSVLLLSLYSLYFCQVFVLTTNPLVILKLFGQISKKVM